MELLDKSFVELKGITKELNKSVKHKQILEQMQMNAKSEYESEGLDKNIVAVTKALGVKRKN